MKKIGIVGGAAWVSTVHYYSELCSLGERLHGVSREFSIESLHLHRAVGYIGRRKDERSRRAFDEYHRQAMLRIAACGA